MFQLANVPQIVIDHAKAKSNEFRINVESREYSGKAE